MEFERDGCYLKYPSVSNSSTLKIRSMKYAAFFWSSIMPPQFHEAPALEPVIDRRNPMIDISKTDDRLKGHLQELTVTIGERSVRFPENLSRTAEYINNFYNEIGLESHSEQYGYREFKVANVIPTELKGNLKLVDLSHPFGDKCPLWPYFEDVKIERMHYMAKSGVLSQKITILLPKMLV